MSRQSSSAVEVLLGLLFGAVLALCMFIYKLYSHTPDQSPAEGDE